MNKNLDLARECGAAIYHATGDIPPLVRFTLAQLDAFAERVRAEQKSGAPEPSGERAALIATLRDKYRWEWHDESLREAADMLAADAKWEQVARAQNAKLMAMADEPGGIEKLRQVLDEAKAQQVTAPQARELSDDEIMDVSGEFVRDALGKTNLLRFARAVLAARSAP